MPNDYKPPFNEGDTVRVKGDHHLGLYRVENCEWIDRTKAGYWLCECEEVREPVDWSKYKPGTTGIVVGSFWRGSSEHLEIVNAQP
jgi:hypothetical protein